MRLHRAFGGPLPPPPDRQVESSRTSCYVAVYGLFDSGQILQQVPVLQTVLLRRQKGCTGIAVLVEMLGKAPLAAGEVNEVDLLAGFGMNVPIVLHVRVAHQAQALFESRALARVVNEYRKAARIGSQLGLVLSHVVAHAVFGLAGGKHIDNRRPRVLIGFHHGFVEMVHVGASGLGDVDIFMHHADAGELLAVFLLARNGGAVVAHLGVLALERTGGSLAAGVGINLRIEDQHLDVRARRHHARQRLEADIVHGAVATDDPEPLVPPAELIPARAHAHGIGRRVFEQRVRPGNLVGIIWVRGSVHRVATGGGHDADVLLAVEEAGSRQHHAQCGGLAASHAGTGAAHVQQRALGEHHIRQRFFVDELGGRLRHGLVDIPGRTVPLHVLGSLANHLEGVVIAAGIDALGAAFALGGVDEDAELSAAHAFPFGYGEVLVGDGPLRGHGLALGFIGDRCQALLERGGHSHFGQDGGVGALRDAVHAADAVGPVKFRDIGGDVAEVAQGAGARGNDAAGGLVIGRQTAFGEAAVVCADHAVVEIGDVHYVGLDVPKPGFVRDGFVWDRIVWDGCHGFRSSCYITLRAALALSASAVDSITSRGTSMASRYPRRTASRLSCTTRSPRLPKYLRRDFSTPRNTASSLSANSAWKGVMRRKMPSSTMPCMRCCRSAREETFWAMPTVSSAKRRAFFSHMDWRAQAGTPCQMAAGSACGLCTKTMPPSERPMRGFSRLKALTSLRATNSTCSNSEWTRTCFLAMVR